MFLRARAGEWAKLQAGFGLLEESAALTPATPVFTPPRDALLEWEVRRCVCVYVFVVGCLACVEGWSHVGVGRSDMSRLDNSSALGAIGTCMLPLCSAQCGLHGDMPHAWGCVWSGVSVWCVSCSVCVRPGQTLGPLGLT